MEVKREEADDEVEQLGLNNRMECRENQKFLGRATNTSKGGEKS